MLYGSHSLSGPYVCRHGRMAAKVVVLIVANFLRPSRATVDHWHVAGANGKAAMAEDGYETPSPACLTTPPALYRTLTAGSRAPGGAARVTEYPRNQMLSSPPPTPPAPPKEFDVSKIWPFRRSTIRYNYTTIATGTLAPAPAPDPLTDQAYSVSVTEYGCGGDRGGDRRKCRKWKPQVEVEDEHAADRFQGTNTVWPLPSYPSGAPDAPDAGHKTHHGAAVFKMPVGQLDLLYTVRRGEEQPNDDIDDSGPCGRRR